MRIQEMMTQCCDGVSKFASGAVNTLAAAAQWFGKTVTVVGKNVAEYAQKAMEYAKPFFENVKNFVSENRNSILIAGISAIVGAIGFAVLNNVFSRSTAPATTTA